MGRCQLPVVSCRRPKPTLSPTEATRVGHPSSSKIDCKSLFRNILPASLVRSIFCGETRKMLKTGYLLICISITKSIFCEETRKLLQTL